MVGLTHKSYCVFKCVRRSVETRLSFKTAQLPIKTLPNPRHSFGSITYEDGMTASPSLFVYGHKL